MSFKDQFLNRWKQVSDKWNNLDEQLQGWDYSEGHLTEEEKTALSAGANRLEQTLDAIEQKIQQGAP